MSNSLKKEDVISNKKSAIKSVNKLLESYINDSSEAHLKKANLISYWLKEYARYLHFEEQFSPTKNIAYKRGNIVKINFGFNVGSEYGGLHYAIVLDKLNAHNSPVLTVVPLTSLKNDSPIHTNDVYLGNEIYKLLNVKFLTLINTAKKELEELNRIIKALDKTKELADESLDKINSSDSTSEELVEDIGKAQTLLDTFNALYDMYVARQEENQMRISKLESIGKEIERMKKGSIAIVNQITTVSKMRIYDPKDTAGVLHGISLSEDSMSLINEKVKDLYIF